MRTRALICIERVLNAVLGVPQHYDEKAKAIVYKKDINIANAVAIPGRFQPSETTGGTGSRGPGEQAHVTAARVPIETQKYSPEADPGTDMGAGNVQVA